MASPREYSSANCNTAEDSPAPLIPGLPDDIGTLCLARVPRWYHCRMRCVSKRWRALVSSQEFLSCRQANNLQETWIYAFCRDGAGKNRCYFFDPDPARSSWKPLPGIPERCVRRDGVSFESLGKKLFLLGGCSWTEDAMEDVYCYDASSNAWEIAPPMPRPRCFFVTSVVDDTLYVIDGEIGSSPSYQTWDTFDLVSNRWTVHEDPKVGPDIRIAIVLDRKIYTFHDTMPASWNVGVFDIESNTWNKIPASEMSYCWHGPVVVVDGSIYLLDEVQGMKLVKWQENGNWESIGRLSSLVMGAGCLLAVVGRRIFVVGRGLRTVVIDVDATKKGSGLLVTPPSIPELDSSLSVICCKTIVL